MYRAELGLRVGDELRASARRHLADAGRRALSREDLIAAAQLLRRALALVPEHELDVPLTIDLADTLIYVGKGEEGDRLLGVLAGQAAALGDPVGEICSRLAQGLLRSQLDPHGPQGSVQELVGLSEEVEPVLEAAEDHYALYLLHEAREQMAGTMGRRDTQLVELEQAAYHAHLAGLTHLAQRLVRFEGGARYFGSTPLTELLSWLEERESEHGRNWRLTHWQAVTLGMLGRFDEARPIMAEFLQILEAHGDLVNVGQYRSTLATTLELLAGDPVAAVRNGEEGCRLLEEAGERAFLSTGCTELAEALYVLDRLDEAEAWAWKGLRLGDSDDLWTQAQSRQVQAKVLARRGQHADAEALAREAVALADTTDGLAGQGHTRADLAEVLELAGRRDEATAILREALDLYERKEALVRARRVRERLAALEPA